MGVRKKILFSAVILGAALLAVELGLRLVDRGAVAKKAWILTTRGMGHCYSTDPQGRFPLDLRRPADRARLEKRFKEGHSGVPTGQDADMSLVALTRQTPHCITYDSALRKWGFFTGRKQQVALVGDSFAFGEGVGDQQTLGYLLGQAFPAANFRTLARPGAEIEDARAMTVRAINDDRLRNVIYFFNLNDVIVEDRLAAELSVGLNHGEAESQLVHRLSALSRIFQLVDSARVAHVRTSAILDGYRRRYQDSRNRAGVERTLEMLADMSNTARSQGAMLLVVLYPLLHRSTLGSYPLAAVHAQLMAECARRKIPCVDGQGAFEGNLSMVKYHVHAADSHPNGRANQALVRHLVEHKSIVLR